MCPSQPSVTYIVRPVGPDGERCGEELYAGDIGLVVWRALHVVLDGGEVQIAVLPPDWRARGKPAPGSGDWMRLRPADVVRIGSRQRGRPWVWHKVNAAHALADGLFFLGLSRLEWLVLRWRVDGRENLWILKEGEPCK